MRTLFSAAVLVLSACSSTMQTGNPAEDVRLTVEPTSVAPGDSITLTLDNRTDVEISYNLCASGLQQQTAAAWDPVQTDVVCTMELRGLAAGQEATHRTAVPTGLESGQYRYFTNIDVQSLNESHRIMSRAFTVR